MEEHPDKHETMTDEQLMLHASNGRKQAFSVIVHRHQQALVNFFRKMGVNNDAWDLAQETFVKLFKFREKYRPKARFTTFMYLVARRIYVDYVRRQARVRSGKDELAEQVQIDDKRHDRPNDRLAEAVEALKQLSEEMRSVVVMNIYQGLRYHEIAEALEIPVGTVKTRMFYAMRKLREVMNNGEK